MSSLCQTCSIETYSFIVRAYGHITVQFGIWWQMLLMIYNITFEKGKKNCRLSDNDAINLQTSLKISALFKYPKLYGLSLKIMILWTLS